MKKIFVFILTIIIAVFACSATACSQFKPVQFESYDYFNVTTRVLIYQKDTDKHKEIFDEINATLKEIDDSINALKESDVARINLSEGGEVKINEITYKVLECALDMYEKTDGAFNIASAGLVDLWGFSARVRSGDKSMPYDRESGVLPSENYIEAFKLLAKELSNCSLKQNDGEYYFNKSNVYQEIDGQKYYLTIDLGGIGKGYAVDRIAEILNKYSIENGYINIGGSSIKVLNNHKNSNGKWEVGIINPTDKDNNYATVDLVNCNISTSGNYQNYFDKDGIRYCHIINPYTGKPIQSGVISASIFGLNAMQADALSTAVCVVGMEKGKQLIQEFKIKGSIVYNVNGNINYVSNDDSLKLIDKSFIKANWND